MLDCLQVRWGSVEMVKAHRALLRAALADPFNQQFQLLCDTVVPIREPSFIHAQLIGHAASRIGHLRVVCFPEKSETVVLTG